MKGAQVHFCSQKVGFIELTEANGMDTGVSWGVSVGGSWEKLPIAFAQCLEFKGGFKEAGDQFSNNWAILHGLRTL